MNCIYRHLITFTLLNISRLLEILKEKIICEVCDKAGPFLNFFFFFALLDSVFFFFLEVLRSYNLCNYHKVLNGIFIFFL